MCATMGRRAAAARGPRAAEAVGLATGAASSASTPGPGIVAPDVLVMGFNTAFANRTCRDLWPLSCMQWPGVHVRDLNEQNGDTRYASVRGAGLIARPRTRKLGNVGLALAHITAWQYVATTRKNHDKPCLIMEEDERVKQPEHIRKLLRLPRSKFDFDFFLMNALRPSGLRDRSTPKHVLRVQPPSEYSGRKLETNVWMGAYALRPAGAARLLDALHEEQPDVSMIVLDVWVARKAADPRTGMQVCVWDQTNQLFRHGDERVSMRRDINGGVVRLLDRAMRTFRGDTIGHPPLLPTQRSHVNNVFGTLETPRASCVRLEACFLTVGFVGCAQLEGIVELGMACFSTADGQARLRMAAANFLGPTLGMLLLPVLLCACCYCICRGRRARRV